jgi:tetratricopeptide (TPR) repeat protein
MAAGWAALQAERFDQAATHYAAAAAATPASEDAWIGQQRAHLGRKAWREAAAAGERALALNPDNVWAHRFQALARYELGAYREARGHYERVLARQPDDALMQLGLGFSLVRLGDERAGHAACGRAAAALPGDPRVAACLALRDPNRTVVTGSLSASGAGSPGGAGTLMATSVTAGARWSSGLSLWAGATLSRLTRDGADWDQAGPLIGLGVLRPGWELWAAGALVLSTDAAADRAGVVLVGTAWHGADVSLGVTAALSLYRSATALQVDPHLTLRLHDRVSVTLGGEVQTVTTPGEPVQVQQPGPWARQSGSASSTEVLGSGRAALSVRLSPAVTLSAQGWYGSRRAPVDAGGLSIWPSADRFTAGWGATLAWRASDPLTLTLTYAHQLGDELDGAPSDFSLIGGTLGAAVAF